MTTDKLPGTSAARHGTGEADLSIMYAAHAAFRRDLESLTRAAAADLTDPARQRAVAAGWEVFKHQLHLHHTAENDFVWPALRTRFANSENALSVLDAMAAEHAQIDPLLAAVDDAFARRGAAGTGPDRARPEGTGPDRARPEGTGPDGAGPDGAGQDGAGPDDWPGVDRLADVTDVLTTSLTAHLVHEERDGLPLIGAGLTAAQWRGVGRAMARKNGIADGSQMFAWMLSGASPDSIKQTMGQLPAPLRFLYRAVWAPRYAKTQRW
jgi:iron-sulfur cluster repair protein YtfE (RIC family)